MKKIIALLIMLITTINLIGCWSVREVNDLGVAVALGVDLHEDNLLEVTVQVIIPRRLAQEGYEGNAVVTYSTTGRTTFEILRKLTSISSRKIYIGHIQLVVLGEELAQSGIFETIDFFERDHEFRRQAHVLVTKGISARDILETGSVIELIPAVHITHAIDNTIHTGATRKVTLIQLFKEINNRGNHIVLPVVINRFETKPQVAKDLRIAGIGVFNGDKLIGYLDEFKTRGYLWAIGEVGGGILVIPSPHDAQGLISLEIINAQGKMEVALVDNEPVLTIKVKCDFNIGEQQRVMDMTTPQMMEYLEKESKELIKEEILKALHQGQQIHRTDFFGFGEVVSKNYPSFWKNNSNQWDNIFSAAKVNIEIDTNIRRSGQVLQPPKPQ
jgi:spore germination protein KC